MHALKAMSRIFSKVDVVVYCAILLALIIPPYGVCFLFVCTVTDFSAVGKDRDVKFCMRIRLLHRVSKNVLWLAITLMHMNGF